MVDFVGKNIGRYHIAKQLDANGKTVIKVNSLDNSKTHTSPVISLGLSSGNPYDLSAFGREPA